MTRTTLLELPIGLHGVSYAFAVAVPWAVPVLLKRTGEVAFYLNMN